MEQFAVSTRKGLFIFSHQEHESNVVGEHFLGDPVSAFVVDAGGDWFAALNTGHFGPKLHRSSDQGLQWQEVGCPALPVSAEGEKGESLQQIWTLVADPKQPGKLWAGCIPAGLFFSDDSGDSWTLVEDLWQKPEREKWFGGGFDAAGIHSIVIHPDQPNCMTIAISCAGVWHSEDYGQHWQLSCKGMRAAYMPEEAAFDEMLQDPHLLVQSPSDPNRMWVQHHNGIFISDDRGYNWREVVSNVGSTFGFAVAVHPKDPSTAWFIPAIKDESRYPEHGGLYVSKAIDSGASFQVERAGLPQMHCYDLVYRHAFKVNQEGTHLVFGSTTGNLWFSNNEGDAWECVSNYLPPIYAIDFIRLK
jgi:hypothetical protein